MDHFEKGLVVPVWVRNRLSGPTWWTAAWAAPDYSVWVIPPSARAERWSSDEFRPRDPNSADHSDRPDLLEQTP